VRRQESRWISWLDRTLYPDHRDRWDDALFRQRVLAHLGDSSRILDLGAGAGRVTEMNFRDHAAWVAGVDVDDAVRANPMLHEAHVIDGTGLPFADASFDLVFSDNVFEHVEDPDRLFAQVHQVLRPGGVFLLKTPNRWHYATLIARLTPLWFHRFVNRLRGRPPEHTFPTLYRANTAARLRELGERAGFRVVSVESLEGRPEYLRITAFSYVLGWVYERIVNSTPKFAGARVVLIGIFRKP
jgi:SAM-dependent methyltransferase